MRSSPISTRNTAQKRTALAAAVISYRGRSALREVAKAMGLSDDISSALSGSIWGWSSEKLGETEAKAGGLDQTDPLLAPCDRPGQRNSRIPPPSFPACRRLRHHQGPARRDRADHQDGDARAQDGRVGQGRPRRGRHPQGRCAGARHAVLPAPRLRSAAGALRRPQRQAEPVVDFPTMPEGGPRGLRHDLPRRHARRLPDRKPRADVACCRG